ncbi:S-adenosyl-L-methionine-dependent methyltransferase [Aspergillus lucknowensis]|uniref:S-adenosyl-L-methionine-dependent methyltransferase n=1 Tax=Aspergillus lucknowensis TaxID=176173 RepID=A0ABR4LSG8_9EURO
MDRIAQQTKELWANAREDERRAIRDGLRDLISSFDTDWDVVLRLAGGPLVVALVKIGINLDIFGALATADDAVTVEDFVESTGATVEMLRRILRTQAAFGLIEQTGIDEYKASRLTTILTDANVSGSIVDICDNLGPIMQVIPEFLSEKKGQTIISNTETAFQKAFNTKLSAFEWMNQHPTNLRSLSHFMAMHREDSWLDKFPVAEEIASTPPEPSNIALVDIGGGYCHQAIQFHQRYPHLGRVVVQDIPTVLDRVQPVDGVEFQVYNFFQPQPLRAKFFYFRHVLHDWNDDDCVNILKETITALGPNSRIKEGGIEGCGYCAV